MLDAWRALMAGTELLTLVDLVARPEWHADALCREYPGEWWFPRQGEPLDRAREVCGRCLVKAECRSWALAQGPTLHGIWAGTSQQERAALRRQPAAA